MKETKKKAEVSIPKRFSFNYRAVIAVLLGTLDRHPISYTSLKRKTHLHDKTLSKILRDLLTLGFVEKEGKDYVIGTKNYSRLKPHLESNKKEDDDFHKSWMGLPLSVILALLVVVGLIASVLYSAPEKSVSYSKIEEYYTIVGGKCVRLGTGEIYNKTVYYDRECTKPYNYSTVADR